MSFARIVPVLLAVLFASSPAWAHKPLLMAEDNGDGTIYVEVGFSDGGSGAGHTIILKEKATGKVISEHKVPAESALDLPMPKVPYIVVFDAGEGHAVEQEGPFIEPKADEAENPASSSATEEESPPPPPQKQAAAPVQPAPPLAPQAAPVVVARQPSGPGMEMALKMMLTTQIVTAVLAAFLFGAVVFWIGYSIGKTQAMPKR